MGKESGNSGDAGADSRRPERQYEYQEIISEALHSTYDGGAPRDHSPADVDLEKDRFALSKMESTVGFFRDKRATGVLLGVLILANIAVIGAARSGREGVLTKGEARTEIQQKYGSRAKSVLSVDDFLNGEERYSGIHDPAFQRALDDLNATLQLDGDTDESQPFRSEEFRFLGQEFVYIARE